jgi:hypothetical protein
MICHQRMRVLDVCATGHKYGSRNIKMSGEVVDKSKWWFVAWSGVVRGGHVIDDINILYYSGKVISRHLLPPKFRFPPPVQTATAPSPRP